MNSDMNSTIRPELDALLGAYALDAVEPVEQRELDAYIANNPRARAEVDEMREAAAMLALVVNERQGAPASVWDNIQSAIESPSLSASRDRASVTSLDSHQVDRDQRQRRQLPRQSWMLVAAATVIAVVLATVVLRSGSNNPNSGGMNAAYNRVVAQHGHRINLTDAQHTTTMADVVLRNDGTGYLRLHELAKPPLGMVYQLWVIPTASTAPVSVGIVAGNARLTPVAITGSFAAVAMSVERAPGAVAPSTPVASGTA